MIFPSRNLPGAAADWGRSVENRISSLDREQTLEFQSGNNGDRSTGSQLATIGRQVEELSYRATDSFFVPPMSVTGTATTPPYPSVIQTLTFPAAVGDRSALLTVSAKSTTTLPSGPAGVLFVRANGVRVIRIVPLGGTGSGIPDETAGQGVLNGFCRINTLSGVDPVIDLEWARGPGSTSSTLTLFDIVVSLTRS